MIVYTKSTMNSGKEENKIAHFCSIAPWNTWWSWRAILTWETLKLKRGTYNQTQSHAIVVTSLRLPEPFFLRPFFVSRQTFG